MHRQSVELRQRQGVERGNERLRQDAAAAAAAASSAERTATSATDGRPTRGPARRQEGRAAVVGTAQVLQLDQNSRRQSRRHHLDGTGRGQALQSHRSGRIRQALFGIPEERQRPPSRQFLIDP